MHTFAKACAFFIGFAVDNIGETGVRSKENIGERMMRMIKRWIGRKPETAGEVRLLGASQGEMFEQMYPLLGQLALHATSAAMLTTACILSARAGAGSCRSIGRAS